MAANEVPVLIVGGGPCGLSSSVFLSTLGVPSLLVERHPGTSFRPKANYLNQRTMEIFRQFGLADQVYERAAPMAEFGSVRWCTTLAGTGPLDRRELYRLDAFGSGALRERYTRDSACGGASLAQMHLEPLLRQRAETLAPGAVLFQQELVALQQDEAGVTATVVDRDNGKTHLVRAQYVIGADGGRTVASALGIELEGPRRLMEMITMHLEADLSEWLPDDSLYHWFLNPEGEGTWASGVLGAMGPTWGRRSENWKLTRAVSPDDPAEVADETSVEQMRERVRQLLGIPNLAVEIRGVDRWIVDSVIATRFSRGRVFLAGDAAHCHPPTTGLGLNSGVQDAHNLTWKLKAVLAGEAGSGLLETYDQERRPVCRRNADWALLTWFQHRLINVALGLMPGQSHDGRRQALEALFAQTPEGAARRARLAEVMHIQRTEFQAHDIELGYAYESGAIVPDRLPPPERDPMGSWYEPTPRPGHRLPHAWLERDGERISSHDLVRPGRYALFAGTRQAWREVARTAADTLGVPLDCFRVGAGGDYVDPEGRFVPLCGLDRDAAVLVRPDVYVAWRSDSGPTALNGALERILRRGRALEGLAA